MKLLRVLLGLGMVGEGLVCAIAPDKYPLIWAAHLPRPCNQFFAAMAQNRELTRVIALIELFLGLWLALKGIEQAPGYQQGE